MCSSIRAGRLSGRVPRLAGHDDARVDNVRYSWSRRFLHDLCQFDESTTSDTLQGQLKCSPSQSKP